MAQKLITNEKVENGLIAIFFCLIVATIVCVLWLIWAPSWLPVKFIGTFVVFGIILAFILSD
jgi:hypothetical protein